MATGTKKIEDLEIVPMKESDLDEVLQIERMSFRVPWSKNMFRQDMAFPLARCLVAKRPVEGKKRVVGYVICWFVADEVHLTNIAVSAELHHGGSATRLLEEALRLARSERMRFCTLEVRLSNEVAKGFYRKLGFEARGVRPKYYSDNNEDAVIMWLDL